MSLIHRVLLAALVLWAGPHAAADTETGPWRLASAAKLPQWLHLAGTHRIRYETLDGQFRAGRGGGDQTLALRTTFLAELRGEALRAGVEMVDSRGYFNDAGSLLNTTLINPAELLQGYLAWDAEDLLAPGSKSTLRAGRLTIDAGSRRLVARNRYRNTINTFTGVEWQWQGAGGQLFQTFYTRPVTRKPRGAAALLDNDIEFDEEADDVRFWGVFYRFAKPDSKRRLELFLYGLDEDDSSDLATRNRELYTPGPRFWKPKARGEFDYLLESVLQFGESRSSTSATRDLEHFAHYHHVEVGYSFAARYAPRVVLRYDYASGDDDPTDGDNGRFDTLFGARRFEYGPTGIYGPFARANLSTPGVRVDFSPAPRVKVFADYRAFWLASSRDAWVAARVVDPAGASGRFVAQQIEARLRWEMLPGNLRFEAGATHLFAGEFIDDAPNSPRQGDATYLYSALVFTF